MITWKDIPGHFNFAKLYEEVLDRCTEDREYHFAEVGVYLGRSVAYMLNAASRRGKRIVLQAIDLWPGELYDAFRLNMTMLQLDNSSLGYVRANSWESAALFKDREFDFVFVDAHHSRESVTKDSRAWLPKVRPGGIIAGHDIKHIPVRQAVQDVFGDVWKERHHCWVVEIPLCPVTK